MFEKDRTVELIEAQLGMGIPLLQNFYIAVSGLIGCDGGILFDHLGLFPLHAFAKKC